MSIFKYQIFRDGNYSFKPQKDLAGKQNFSRNLFVDSDGGISEVVRLNVLDDRHREEIVAYHFCQQYGKLFHPNEQEQPQFYIVERDNPWDFTYVLHDGSGFNLEICRVADKALLKALKIENDCSILLRKAVLKGFEISKVEKHFPGTFSNELLREALAKSARNRKFKNPTSAHEGPRIFMRPPMQPNLDVGEAIIAEIRKKAAKKHSDKDETILLLDNLTTHNSPDDFFDAVETYSEELRATPFRSIWLYTGYYSDNQGYDCEFSILPLNTDSATLLMLDAGG